MNNINLITKRSINITYCKFKSLKIFNKKEYNDYIKNPYKYKF